MSLCLALAAQALMYIITQGTTGFVKCLYIAIVTLLHVEGYRGTDILEGKCHVLPSATGLSL